MDSNSGFKTKYIRHWWIWDSFQMAKGITTNLASRGPGTRKTVFLQEECLKGICQKIICKEYCCEIIHSYFV